MQNFFEKAAMALREGRSFVMVHVVEAEGSSPGKPGFRMIIYRNGETLGTVGGGALESMVVNEAMKMFSSAKETELRDISLSDIGMTCGGSLKIFLERFETIRIYIFGSGHIGKALENISRSLGFKTVVVDKREHLAAKFPDSETVAKDAVDFARGFDNCRDFMIVATDSHKKDFEIVRALLEKERFYVGVLGSRNKAKSLFDALRKSFDDARLGSIHCPVGIDINSRSAEEIAVSIMAEIIKIKNENPFYSRKG